MNDRDAASELQDLKEQLAELRRAARVRWRYTLIGGTLLLCTGAMTATAQVVTESLKVFTGGTPAVASDVNANFALLKQWIERKVGAVSNGDNVTVKSTLNVPAVSATTVSATTVSATTSVSATTVSATTVTAGSSSLTSGSLTLNGAAAAGSALTVNGTTTITTGLNVGGKTLGNIIRDYVREKCSISFGWTDVCTNPSACLPAKSGKMFGSGACTGTLQGGDASCNDNWFKLNLDGNVNDDDSLFIRFNCD